MDWLPPDEYPVWKLLLRDGDASPGFAAEVAQIVAGIHARTAHDPVLAERFANDRNFFELRLDPYFIAASRAHPDCAPVLTALATSTAGRRIALVHGDISPKNLLAGPHGPIILDAECAWYGDPAFDAAFCLCHLLAKCLWQPAHADLYLQSFDAFAAAYLARVDWEARTANDGAEGIESRIAWLLAGLLLARVDGKSPLEYLDEPGRQRQRRFAREWLLAPLPAAQRTLGAMREGWQQLLGSPG